MHKRDLKNVIHTKAMPSAGCHTNHHLVRWKLGLLFKTKPRKGSLPKKNFNLNKHQSTEVKADFQAGLQSKFENSDCPEDISSEILCDQLSFCRHLKRFWCLPPEQPRDSGTASEEEIIPPRSAVMSFEEGCLPSHQQHPPVQASRDAKWVVGQYRRELSNTQT